MSLIERDTTDFDYFLFEKCNDTYASAVESSVMLTV